MVDMSRGREIGKNPDVPSNILIVCSWCHDKLQYGTRQVNVEIYSNLLERGVINQSKIDELRLLHII